MAFIIDPVLSSLILTSALVLGLMVLGSYLAYFRKPPFGNAKVNRIYRASVFLFPFVLLFVMRVGCSTRYGYVNEITAMTHTAGKICLLDMKENCDPDGGLCSEEFRLHIVDPATGKRLHREYVGSRVKLLDSRAGLLLLKRGEEFPLYDAARREIIRVVDRASLAKKYASLRGGVAKIDFDAHGKERTGPRFLKVEAKSGEVFHLDPFSGELGEGPPPLPARDDCAVETGRACLPLREGPVRMSLVSSPHSYKLKLLRVAGQDAHGKAGERTYLEGKFLLAHPSGIVLIKSFESTDHDNYVITAAGPDGALRWRLTQKKIGGYDWFSRKPRLDAALTAGERIIFNSGGILFCADAKSGKVLWRTRL